MKIIHQLLFFLFLIESLFTSAQELQSTTLFPPDTTALTDLSFLKQELEGKQLILLGEETHMYGNIFEMKARVIEYLHQELGFTTIAMEASMYDIWKMNQHGFSAEEFNNAIWGVWSGSLEFQRLVNYIEKNNLKVIGFDSQVQNTKQFIDDFYNYLEDHHIELKLDADDVGIIIEGILETVTVDQEDIAYTVYEKELKRILKQLEKLEKSDDTYYWIQFTKNLLACSQDAYYNKEEILTTDFGNKNYNIRDEQMANNLLSYKTRHPEEKLIVWADNIHSMTNTSSIQKPVVKEFISMGTHLKKALDQQVYSLASIHANDSLYDPNIKKWEATPIQPASFEDALQSLQKPYVFVSAHQPALQQPKTTRLLNFIEFTTARVDQLHDGYLFFKHATLPKISIATDVVQTTPKQLEKGKSSIPLNKSATVLLKGRILDAENKTPVPYATLILKNEGIYRVADANGYFELPVTQKMLDTAAVSIASLGFTTAVLPLQNITENNFLQPKFEELSAVVVTGNLSPAMVLKKAIAKKEINHPTEAFNFHRYGKILINRNDSTQVDLEVITKDEDKGYTSPYVITQKMEQIKWNTNLYPKKYRYVSQFFSYRQNAIRYANILHKRKYKKFDLHFISSNNPADAGQYIIAFKTDRNRWNYTNRGYPTAYSGRVYIDKNNFAILKVVENWATTLSSDELKKHFKGNDAYKNIIEDTIKEENICVYTSINEDGKYYATKYFNRSYQEVLTKEHQINRSVSELDSYLYDFELENVEEIEYEWREKKYTILNSVSYDKAFWNSFYKKLNTYNIK